LYSISLQAQTRARNLFLGCASSGGL
jgi:hypothetical protein